VFTQLNLAGVNRGTTISSYDIESAFTITTVDSEKLNGKRKYVRVRSDIVKYFLEVDPTLSQYVTSIYDIVFELAYWLYRYYHDAVLDTVSLIALEAYGYMCHSRAEYYICCYV
jgi:hypothetical protein